MIDGSEKRKRQLAFEPQNSRVFEKRSNFFIHNSVLIWYFFMLWYMLESCLFQAC